MKIPTGYKYLILAAVVALVATVLIHRYISLKTTIVSAPVDQVVVAAVDIDPGTAISARQVALATYPKDIIPPNAFRTLQQVEGRVTQTFISKNELVLPTRLAPEGTAAGLGGLLKPGYLAVTVHTDEVSGVAGFINPGDYVDVLTDISSTGGEHYSKIILQNLRVLSKGQVTEQSGEKKAEVKTTVTLEVTPEQAEVLNLASFQGKIRLALRNTLNPKLYATKGVKTSELVTSQPPPPPVEPIKMEQPEVKAPPPPREHKVEIIKGMKKSTSGL